MLCGRVGTHTPGQSTLVEGCVCGPCWHFLIPGSTRHPRLREPRCLLPQGPLVILILDGRSGSPSL